MPGRLFCFQLLAICYKTGQPLYLFLFDGQCIQKETGKSEGSNCHSTGRFYFVANGLRQLSARGGTLLFAGIIPGYLPRFSSGI